MDDLEAARQGLMLCSYCVKMTDHNTLHHPRFVKDGKPFIYFQMQEDAKTGDTVMVDHETGKLKLKR